MAARPAAGGARVMAVAGGGPRTAMAAELAGDRAALEAKYAATRRSVGRAYRWRHVTRAADRLWGALEDLVVGGGGCALDLPVFVTGSFRSGTTMLERILAEHPALATFDHLSIAFPRSPYLARLLRRLLGPGPASVPPDQPNLMLGTDSPAEGEPLWRASRGSPWSDAPSHVLGAELDDPRLARRVRRAIYKHLSCARRSRFLNKNPLHTLRVGFLARTFPTARFVHVVRHPHRVLRSQLDLELMWAAVLGCDRDWGAAFCDTFMPPGRRFPRTPRSAEIEHWRQRDPARAAAISLVDFERCFDLAVEDGDLAPRVHRVHYEDLLERFEPTMAEVLEHLALTGEDADAIVARAAAGFVDHGLLSRTTPLPRFESVVETELAELRCRHGYADP